MTTGAVQMPPMASNAIDGKWKAPSGVRLAPSGGFSSHRQGTGIGGIDVERSNFNLQEAIAAAPKSGTIGIPPSPNPRAALLANLRTAPRMQATSPDSPKKSPPTPRSPPSVSALHMAALSASARNRNKEANANMSATQSRSKPAPLPLNLSDSQPVGNSNVPHSATLPPKTAQRLGLTPRSSTFPAQQYMQMMQQQQRVTSPQFAAAIYAQQQMAYQSFAMPQTPSTPLLVLSQPDEHGEIVPGTPAPYILPADQVYNNIAVGYDAEGPFYYHYDYEVEYTPPTPTSGTTHMRHKSADARSQRPSVMHTRSLSSTSSNGGTERRKSRLDPDAILPMRQPRGPDLNKNFATRIRRRNIKTILSAAAERRNGVRGEGTPATPMTPTIKIDESELTPEASAIVVEGLTVSSPSSDPRRRSAIF